MKLTGKILTVGKKQFTKTTGDGTPGKNYVLCNVELNINGKPLIVTAQFTEKESGETLEIGQEVGLYRRVLPSNNGTGMVNFFEISSNMSASNEEINALLGIPETAN